MNRAVRRADPKGVAFGAVAVLVLAAAAAWLATVSLSTSCSSVQTVGQRPVTTCESAPSAYASYGPQALAWMFAPAALCAGALACTPSPRARAGARWMASAPLLAVTPLAVFTPFMPPLMVAAACMSLSAAFAHSPERPHHMSPDHENPGGPYGPWQQEARR